MTKDEALVELKGMTKRQRLVTRHMMGMAAAVQTGPKNMCCQHHLVEAAFEFSVLHPAVPSNLLAIFEEVDPLNQEKSNAR